MVLLLSTDVSQLGVNSLVVSGGFHVTNDTESDGESITITHQGEFQLQGVILTVSIVYENVIQRVAILADLDNFQAKTLLYETELIVLTEG